MTWNIKSCQLATKKRDTLEFWVIFNKVKK